ncbi:MAG: superoxide dismutase [Acetanaerobacterium sp.]
MNECYPYKLIPLPYDYDALEPYINEETMRLHHDKHLGAYVANLNKALTDYPALQKMPLTTLLARCSSLPEPVSEAVCNNGGGVYNHDLFFSLMSPEPVKTPSGPLLEAINQSFGSLERWRERFKACALGRFGSGWAWLAVCHGGWLTTASTANQDVLFPTGVCPILLLDVWEHAYYLQYQNRRAEYIDNWFNIVDWSLVEARYDACLKGKGC